MMASIRDDADLQLNLFGPGVFDPEPIFNHEFYIVEDVERGHAVGFVQLANIDKDAGTAMAGACIAPPHQRRGYAHAALTALHERALELGVRLVRVKIMSANTPALLMCEKLGYRQTGSRVRGDINLVLMEKEL